MDIEDALRRLDNLTREEVQMATTQVLKAINELKDGAQRLNQHPLLALLTEQSFNKLIRLCG